MLVVCCWLAFGVDVGVRGTELYPRIFGWDVKVFTNCRFGMMFWALVSDAMRVITVDMHQHACRPDDELSDPSMNPSQHS